MTDQHQVQQAGSIPTSTALAEAKVDSLGELFSRDPEQISPADLDRMIEALRAQRVRWQATEGQGKARQPKISGTKASDALKKLVAPGTPDDLGL